MPHYCAILGQLAPGTDRVLPGSPGIVTSRHGAFTRSSFHVKRIVRRFDRALMPWKPAHQRVASRGRRAQGPLYLERFRLAASLMVLARSSEPRSPVVQFHVKRLGGNVGSRVPCRGSVHRLPPLTVTARCGRRCHERQYSDAAGAPPHPLTPSVLSAEAAHQSFRTASWGNWVFNASIRVQLRSGIDAR